MSADSPETPTPASHAQRPCCTRQRVHAEIALLGGAALFARAQPPSASLSNNPRLSPLARCPLEWVAHASHVHACAPGPGSSTLVGTSLFCHVPAVYKAGSRLAQNSQSYTFTLVRRYVLCIKLSSRHSFPRPRIHASCHPHPCSLATFQALLAGCSFLLSLLPQPRPLMGCFNPAVCRGSGSCHLPQSACCGKPSVLPDCRTSIQQRRMPCSTHTPTPFSSTVCTPACGCMCDTG